MFNYIKDVIINDVTNTVVKDADTNTLVIKRGANYKFDNIYHYIYKIYITRNTYAFGHFIAKRSTHS